MRDSNALRIGNVHNRAIVQLKSWMPGRASPTLPLPTVPAECRLLTLAPGEWLLISDTLAANTLREHGRQLNRQGIAAADLSPGLAAIQLEGPAARDVLTKSCGLDLDPATFPAGTCTRTRLAQLLVIVDYIDPKPLFELYVGCSYRSYLMSWLNDAAAGFREEVASSAKRQNTVKPP
jgi:sarcosine oxidase, subunit gamma